MNRRFRRTEQRVRPTLTNWSVADVAAWAEDSDGKLRRVERSIPNAMLFIEPRANSSNRPGYVLHKCLVLVTDEPINSRRFHFTRWFGLHSPAPRTLTRYRDLVVARSPRLSYWLAHLANSHANATRIAPSQAAVKLIYLFAHARVHAVTSIAHCRLQFRLKHYTSIDQPSGHGQQATLHSIEGKKNIVLSTPRVRNAANAHSKDIRGHLSLITARDIFAKCNADRTRVPIFIARLCQMQAIHQRTYLRALSHNDAVSTRIPTHWIVHARVSGQRIKCKAMP